MRYLVCLLCLFNHNLQAGSSALVYSATNTNNNTKAAKDNKSRKQSLARLDSCNNELKVQNEPEPCAICLEEHNETTVMLKCTHRYHRACILSHKQINQDNALCPLCRDKIENQVYSPAPLNNPLSGQESSAELLELGLTSSLLEEHTRAIAVGRPTLSFCENCLHTILCEYYDLCVCCFVLTSVVLIVVTRL